MIIKAIRKVVDGESLNQSEAERVMGEMMDGRTTSAQIACFVTALRMKGESVDEVTGFSKAMRQRAEHWPGEGRFERLVDTCGTGGDGGKTFNVSTAAALVAAAAGVDVVKHGNRAVSSQSGSADVLEALGIQTTLTPEKGVECLQRTHFCFLFAPQYHPASRHAAQTRQEIRIRTVFNLLGPINNPAGAKNQVIGVYDAAWLRVLPEVLHNLGSSKVLFVASEDGLDEISVSARTQVAELNRGKVRHYTVTPEELHLSRHGLEELGGGEAAYNAAILEAVFKGETGAARDMILANAAAALYVADQVGSLREGVGLAAKLIDSGAVWQKLTQLRQVTEELN